MNDQLASRIEQATPKVEALRPAEPVKPPEKPGLAEQNIIKRIDQDGDPNKVLKDIADGVQPTLAGGEKTPFDQFVEDASETEKTPIVGGEIVTPGARKADEKDNTGANQRGWLAAINSANANSDLPIEQRQQNIQDIVTAAKAAGVSTDALRDHLQSLGIGVTSVEQASVETPSEVQTSISEDRIKAYLTEISLQVPKVTEGSLTIQQFQEMVDDAKAAGVPRDRLKVLLESKGVTIKPPDTNETQSPNKSSGKDKEELTKMPSGESATWVRTGANFDNQDNLIIRGPSIFTVMSRPGASGYYTAENDDNVGIHIPPEIDKAALKDEVNDGDYLMYVAEKMGWKYDSTRGEVFVPPGQYERLTKEQYNKIKSVSGNKRN